MPRILLILAFTIQSVSALANPVTEGDWMIELTPDTGAPINGLLALQRNGEDWSAYVEGGPVPVVIDGDRIELLVDTRDLRGFIFFMRLKGTNGEEGMTGTFTIESDAPVNASAGSWTAERRVPVTRDSEPRPVDLSGIWSPLPGRDFRKYVMDLTPAAEEWHAGYLMHYDQPNVRCASPGITAMVAWGAYPFEILDTDGRLTFLYEFDSEVRRIFLDGREPPAFYPNSGMGFSTARWEGSELVVNTTLLSRNTRDFRGEPVSEQAQLEEVYSLSEDGQTMTAVITLHDPDNYRRPPIRRRAWARKAGVEMYPNECDPDSFYRQMYNENLLDMYFERSRRRF